MTHHGILGMIGCPILEDEMAYILARDGEITRFWFVETDECRNLMRKLGQLRPDAVMGMVPESEIDSLSPPDGLSTLIWMKSMALHEDPDRLRDEVVETMSTMERKCGSILMFYGLCGNAFKDIDTISKDFTTPVTILRDEKDQIVDDCICVPLGGTEGYLSLLKRYPGVFYMTPAWAENWEELIRTMEIFRGMEDGKGWDDLKFVFEMANYTQLLKIHTGLGDEEILDSKSREFAEIFDFEELTLEDGWCSLDITERSYARAKSYLGDNGH
jgi:hypothetical protein